MDAQEIIRSLDLRPHPEGGWYRELHRSALRVTTSHASRCALTSIYYLLQHHERSRWHTVEPMAGWFVRGVLAPPATRTDPAGAQSEPAAVIPAGTWQAARTLGDYSLIGCSVGPGFEFADFRFVSELRDHVGHFTEAMLPLRELL
jgi:predicted cupin superfamily sugar epimerase